MLTRVCVFEISVTAVHLSPGQGLSSLLIVSCLSPPTFAMMRMDLSRIVRSVLPLNSASRADIIYGRHSSFK